MKMIINLDKTVERRFSSFLDDLAEKFQFFGQGDLASGVDDSFCERRDAGCITPLNSA